jgi:hypothetical protein
MNEFQLVLPNEKLKTYRYVTLFVIIINVLVSGFLFYHTTVPRTSQLSLLALVLGSVGLIITIVRFKKSIFKSFRVEILFIILALTWIILGEYLLGACVMLFAILGFYTNKKFIVVFSEAHISYPAFPPKIYAWNDVTQVILKDHVLTIDLKNNKLIQVVIAPESAGTVDEGKFNLFCQKQLKNQLDR